MVKRAFTLIELIFAVSLVGFIAGGGFLTADKIYESYNRAKSLTFLSTQSNLLFLQIGSLLSFRIPSSVIGYDPSSGKFESLYTSSKSYKVLEWIGGAKESFKNGEYSSFLDMEKSQKDKNLLFSPDTNLSLVNKRVQDKFGKNADVFSNEDAVLIFSGSFDEGASPYMSDFKDFYGWHFRESKKIFPIKRAVESEYFELTKSPKKIYEKYFLADSAYALARGEDTDMEAECIKNLPIKVSKDTLFLFYDFRPWKKESFCADKNALKKGGKVTVLALNSKGFEAEVKDDSLILNVTLFKKLKNNKEITFSLQKVLF